MIQLEACRNFCQNSNYYTYDQTDKVIDMIWPYVEWVKSGKKMYLNLPCAFDTETSSFYDTDGNKTGIMYIWMLSLCGICIIGRTWDEFLYTYDRIVDRFATNLVNKYIIFYIHYAGFDFEFLRKHLSWAKVFAMDTHQPLYAVTTENIEFRDSLKLAGMSLDRVGRNLQFFDLKKKVGDLDYRKIRHSLTPLSDEEIGYCIADVKVLCAYIYERMIEDGDITKIPLTKTGYVRRFCRESCMSKPKFYRQLMNALTMEESEFIDVHQAFMGGFTHSNPCHTDIVLENVTAWDITSSYPSVMVAELYPMSKGKLVHPKTKNEALQYMKTHACIFQCRFQSIRPRIYFDNYISISKCWPKPRKNVQISNGRVVSADEIILTLTEVDFMLIQTTYSIGDWSVSHFWIYERDYLPSDFVRSILTLYQQKTILKGVEGKEVEYLRFKEMQNSCYGMTVMNPVRDIYNYDTEWLPKEQPELKEAILAYNNSRNRFLSYPWGIYVTAYARLNLWTAILHCGDDHVYSDTDSEKCINGESHQAFFERYNRAVLERLKKACKSHGIPFDMCTPKNKYGIEKPLGVWDNEGVYKRFKTLGAKRYLYEDENDNYHMVVAGIGKSAIDYLLNESKESGVDIFELFQDGLTIPKSSSGRLTHTYIKETRRGVIKDYLGNYAEYEELTGIHMEPSEYTMGMARDYIEYLAKIKETEIL